MTSLAGAQTFVAIEKPVDPALDQRITPKPQKYHNSKIKNM